MNCERQTDMFQEKCPIWLFCTLALPVILVVVELSVTNENRQEDRQLERQREIKEEIRVSEKKNEERKEAEPAISFAEGSFRVDRQLRASYLTLKNDSPKTTVAITGFNYRISDPALLRQIEHRLPHGSRNGVKGALNTTDRVVFHDGRWTNREEYTFHKRVGLHIPPGNVGDLELKIVNQLWNGPKCWGTLEILYTGPGFSETRTLRLNNVTVLGGQRRWRRLNVDRS